MRKVYAAVAAVFMLAAAGLFAAQTDNDTTKFLQDTFRDGKHEVAMGKMAADKAANADVKKFGQTMADDHAKMNTELQDLAQKLGVDLGNTDFAAMHKEHADRFDKATGAAFDREFMKWAVDDHTKGTDNFQNYIKNGKNADTVAFAGRWLPGLKNHLQMAQDLNDRVSKGAMGELREEEKFVSSEQPLPATSEEKVSIREKSYEEPVAVREERREVVRNRVEEPIYERGENVSYEEPEHTVFFSSSDSCGKCEKVKSCDSCNRCNSCNSCNTCGEFTTFMYDGDWRDGTTHPIHAKYREKFESEY